MLRKIFLFVLFTNAALAGEVWNSQEGLKRLDRSQFKNDFYQLVNFYQPQINPVYCGVASSTIILNALNYGQIPDQKTTKISRPNGEKLDFKIFTQEGFLNEKTNKIKSREVIEYKTPAQNGEYDPGISIHDLSLILSQSYHLKTTQISIEKNNQESITKFRQTVKNIFSEKGKFLIANFDGRILSRESSGHFSPLVAYDEESDSILVMDVALHKNQWFWANIEDLVKAMNTKDGENYRGYLLVERQ